MIGLRISFFLSYIICIINPGLNVNTISISDFKLAYLNPNGIATTGSVTFNCTGLTSKQYFIYLVNEYYSDGYLLTSGKINSNKLTVTFTCDNKHNGLNNKIKISYGVINSFLTTITNEIKTLTSFNSVITVDDYEFKTGGGYLICENMKWKNAEEAYKFHNFTGEYIPSYYHYLSFDDLEISKIAPSDDLKIKNIDLYLTNRNSLFNDMPLNGSYMKVPLKLVNYEGVYKLELLNVYYVNPVTMLMSSTYKIGYVQTKHIYFPHNEMKYQGEYQGRIVFSGFNSGNSNLSYVFKLNAQLNLLGDCIDSEYCVITKDAVENELAHEI